MIRLYGTLSVIQRRTLVGGQAMSLSNLDSEQIASADQILFGTNAGLTVQKSDAIEDRYDLSVVGKREIGTPPNDYRPEPTEAMPSGLPSDGFLTLNVVASFFVVPEKKVSNVASTTLDAPGLAMYQFYPNADPARFPNGEPPKIAAGRFGKQMDLHFTFHVAPEIVAK